MQNSFLVVLPKLSSYMFQDDTEKLRISKAIRSTVGELTKQGYIPTLIAEDELAIELLLKEDHHTMSALPKLSRIFLVSCTSISKNYEGMGKCLELPEYTKESAQKFKLLDRVNFEGSDEEYNSYKIDVYNKRIRHTVYGYYTTFSIILFFDKKNNYANIYKPRAGDAKLYMEVDLNTELINCYFTGVPVDKTMFYKIVEGLYDT